MAATAEPVLKPDFATKRKHFLFTDEHEQLRESIRSFAQKELAPHAEEWEETRSQTRSSRAWASWASSA